MKKAQHGQIQTVTFMMPVGLVGFPQAVAGDTTAWGMNHSHGYGHRSLHELTKICQHR